MLDGASEMRWMMGAICRTHTLPSHSFCNAVRRLQSDGFICVDAGCGCPQAVPFLCTSSRLSSAFSSSCSISSIRGRICNSRVICKYYESEKWQYMLTVCFLEQILSKGSTEVTEMTGHPRFSLFPYSPWVQRAKKNVALR